MRKEVLVVFEDVIAGTTGATSPAGDIVVYTDARFNERLGQYDKLSVQGIANQTSVGTMQYNVQLEHSNDGRNWGVKSTLYSRATNMATNTQYVDAGSDAGSTPSLGLVRLAIRITAPASSTVSMHLKLMVCLRDDA